MGKVCLAVVGASGRMGQEVVNLSKDSKDFDLKAQVSRSGPMKSLNDVNQNIDVVIDFSLKENFIPIGHNSKIEGSDDSRINVDVVFNIMFMGIFPIPSINPYKGTKAETGIKKPAQTCSGIPSP